MSLLFEPGPWDKREGVTSAHVFSKQRKLLYGADHDHANIDGDNPEGYGERVHDRMHHIWRRGALRSLAESARKKGEVRVYKGVTSKSSLTGWPGEHQHRLSRALSAISSFLSPPFILIQECINSVRHEYVEVKALSI